MFPSDYLIYLQIILFLFITPGLPRVVIVSHTLNYGLKKSVWTAVGDVTANTIQGILVVFLIGSFLSDNPQILYYLKWAGILYIVYLAYDTYTAKISSVNSREQRTKSILSFYKDGFMVAGLSPKAIIFFGTIFLITSLNSFMVARSIAVFIYLALIIIFSFFLYISICKNKIIQERLLSYFILSIFSIVRLVLLLVDEEKIWLNFR